MILPGSLIPSDKYFLKNLTFVVLCGTKSFLAYRTSRPVGQEGHCFLVVCSSPWPRKEFDWNGDVATRVDMRTTKGKFLKKYLSEGMSDPGKIICPGR